MTDQVCSVKLIYTCIGLAVSVHKHANKDLANIEKITGQTISHVDQISFVNKGLKFGHKEQGQCIQTS